MRNYPQTLTLTTSAPSHCVVVSYKTTLMLQDEGKNFMAEMAANSGLTNEDLTEAMKSAANCKY